MSVAAVTMAVESRAAEAAIVGRPAIGFAVRTGHDDGTGSTVDPRHQAHRHGADGCTSHQRQYDTTRAFHGCDPVLVTVRSGRDFPSPAGTCASESDGVSQ